MISCLKNNKNKNYKRKKNKQNAGILCVYVDKIKDSVDMREIDQTCVLFFILFLSIDRLCGVGVSLYLFLVALRVHLTALFSSFAIHSYNFPSIFSTFFCTNILSLLLSRSLYRRSLWWFEFKFTFKSQSVFSVHTVWLTFYFCFNLPFTLCRLLITAFFQCC